MSERTIVPQLTLEPAPAAGPPQEETVSPPPGAVALVWGVWACLLLASNVFVIRFSVNAPYCEDFLVVKYVTGVEPLTFEWLWQQESEHRVPLPKLITALVPMLTGTFRAAPLLYILGLGALTCGLIVAVRRMRGWTTYTDVFIPLSLMWLGFTGEATWYTSRIYYMMSTYLAGVVLIIILCRGIRLGLAAGIATGVCLALLPLCGGPGLVYLPALLVWLLVCAVVSWFSPEPGGRRNSLVMLGLLLVTGCVVALYFLDFELKSAEFAPPSHDLMVAGEGTLAALAAGFGSEFGKDYWQAYRFVILLLLVTTAGVLFAALLRPRQPADRSFAWGLFFFGGAILTNGLAIGWGRGSMGYVNIFFMYSPLMVLTSCTLYCIWTLWRPSPWGMAGQVGLVALALTGMPFNVYRGYEDAKTRRDAIGNFQQEMLYGFYPYQLIARHAYYGFGVEQHEWLARNLVWLRDADVGMFGFLREDPPLRKIWLPLTPHEFHNGVWYDTSGSGTGADSYLLYKLPQPLYVAYLRLNSLVYSDQGTPNFRVYWRHSQKNEFTSWEQYTANFGVDSSLRIYVADTIDEFRIHPNDKPFDIVVAEVSVLSDPTVPP